jgi:hypothetical protein
MADALDPEKLHRRENWGGDMQNTCRRARVSNIALCLSFLMLVDPAIPRAGAQDVAKSLNIVIVDGDEAVNNIRQRTAREPIVQVEDENRRPVAGAAVTFFLPNQGAGATFPNGARSLTVTTGSDGRAVARGLRPNNVEGKFEIRVSASRQGRTASAVITQTNIAAAAAAAGGISAKLLALIIAGGAAAAAGTAIAVSRGGNGNGGAAAATPPTVIAPGSPSVTVPR